MLDLLIRGGRLVDGTGNPWRYGDVAVQGGRIIDLGHLAGAQARRVIDAAGLVVAPGFIDAHCHSEMALLANPRHEHRVRQGITSELLGQDGISYAPISPRNRAYWREYMVGLYGPTPEPWDWSTIAEYLARYDGQVATNVAYLLPHGVIRYEVMGNAQRPPTADELRAMQALVAQGMAEGAVGLSTGLYYEPAIWADVAEMAALCEPVAEAGGAFVAHMRGYMETAAAALEECLEVGRRSGAAVHISHFNVHPKTILPLVDRARDEGIAFTYDLYPYRAGSTILSPPLGAWLGAGGVEASLARLRTHEARERLRDILEQDGKPRPAWEAFVISGVNRPENRCYEGLSLPQAAELAGQSLTDFVVELLLAERMAVTIIGHQNHRDEEQVAALMRHPCQMFGSDAVPVGGKPHPRGHGTYPRILGHYVRERKVLTLEEAVRKMTSLPAQHIGLRDRGLLARGMAADVVCFDAERVIDRATYEEGSRMSEGIVHVLVNGQLVLDTEVHTGALPGRALRRA